MLSVSLRLFDHQDETYDNVAHLHDASYVATLNDPFKKKKKKLILKSQMRKKKAPFSLGR